MTGASRQPLIPKLALHTALGVGSEPYQHDMLTSSSQLQIASNNRVIVSKPQLLQRPSQFLDKIANNEMTFGNS